MTPYLLCRVIGLLTICGLVLVTLTSCTIVLAVGRHAMTLPQPKQVSQPTRSTHYEVFTKTFLPYATAAVKRPTVTI